MVISRRSQPLGIRNRKTQKQRPHGIQSSLQPNKTLSLLLRGGVSRTDHFVNLQVCQHVAESASAPRRQCDHRTPFLSLLKFHNISYSPLQFWTQSTRSIARSFSIPSPRVNITRNIDFSPRRIRKTALNFQALLITI